MNNHTYNYNNYIINKDIHIYGDSHARSFTVLKEVQHKNVTQKKLNLKLMNKSRDSATIRGLTNENSTLQYQTFILQDVKNYLNKKDSIIVLKFGQVDIEYSYYFKNIVKNENIKFVDFCRDLINSYKQFITKIRSIYNHKIIISCINLPNYTSDKHLRTYLKKIFDLLYTTKTIVLTSKQIEQIDILTIA